MSGWYDERREARARAYDRAQARLFVLRFAFLFALAAIFWLTGWSRALAEGLQAWLPYPLAWPVRTAAFVALAVFGYEAVLFPLAVLADYSLEKAHGRLDVEFGAWLRGFILSLLLELAIVTAGFTGLYLLLRLFPQGWWLAATGIYAALMAGLGEWGPVWLLPRVRPPLPGGDDALADELRRVGRAAGLDILGAAWWNFEHQEELDPVRVIGAGRRCRAVFSAAAWRELGRREQVFLAARQMAWRRHGAAVGAAVLQTLLAAGVFWGAGRLAQRLALARGLSGAADLPAFPFLVAALFAFAALAGVVAHAVTRLGELRADRFALRHAGGVAALQACLRHDFEREPFAVDLPVWQVALLRRMPTAAKRLARARQRTAPPSAPF